MYSVASLEYLYVFLDQFITIGHMIATIKPKNKMAEIQLSNAKLSKNYGAVHLY